VAGTTNILVFNSSQANQETDAAYLADTTRIGGAGVDGIWPSDSANKTLYQLSVIAAGLAQMMANKGFSISDSNYATLVTQLSNILTTADLRSNIQTLAWSPAIALNAAAFQAFSIPLQGATELSLTGVVAGQIYVVLYAQDSAGGHAVAFSPAFGSGAMQPDPTANAASAQMFIANAALNLTSISPLMSASGINNTPVGNSSPSTGKFTTLTLASGAPSGQVLTGNGTSYVPALPASPFTYGSNANGYWEKNSDGKLDQWNAGVSGTTSINVTFPVAFVNVGSISVVVTDGAANIFLSAYVTSVNGFTIIAPTGQAINAQWRAVGY
jgi:hypothetical protein